MKPSLINYIKDHSKNGIWTGLEVDGVPSVRYQGKTQPVAPFLKQMNIKLTKADKYKERESHAGMGESQSEGHTSDTGDGISESQE
jgi:hypothetical protein